MPIPRITRQELLQEMQKLVQFYGYPNTPGNKTSFSEDFIEIWFSVFQDKSYNQVKNAIKEHIKADDSPRGVFPLPGRILKFVQPESKYTQEELKEMVRKQEEEKAKREREQNPPKPVDPNSPFMKHIRELQERDRKRNAEHHSE